MEENVPETPDHQAVVRPATTGDVSDIERIVNNYASQGLMLPKSERELYENLRDFVVVRCEGRTIGCGALHIYWHDLAEIRSLAVVEDWLGKGIGRLIVERLLQQARALAVARVFALTYNRAFFGRLGFEMVSRESLPQKIWKDCMNCPKYPDCDETAVILNDLEGHSE